MNSSKKRCEHGIKGARGDLEMNFKIPGFQSTHTHTRARTRTHTHTCTHTHTHTHQVGVLSGEPGVLRGEQYMNVLPLHIPVQKQIADLGSLFGKAPCLEDTKLKMDDQDGKN